MRTIVTVATGPRFNGGIRRLLSQLPPGYPIKSWVDIFPPGSPTQQQNPYAFKLYAISNVLQEGFTSVLWLDSSTVFLNTEPKPGKLGPLWRHIWDQGYCIFQNYDFKVGDFCCEESLDIMHLTRRDAFNIPLAVGGCIGLDLTKGIAAEFLNEWERLMLAGAFRGTDHNHRHDQTVAAVVAHRLHMTLTMPPKFWSEQCYPTSEETILTVCR